MIKYIKNFFGINIKPKAVSENDEMGDLEVLSGDGKLRHHNGTSNSPIVTEAHSATLTNKTIDADSNTISNIDNADIKAGAAIDATKIADGSVSNTEFQYLDGVTSGIQGQLDGKASDGTLSAHTGASSGVHGVTGSVVGTTDTQTLTNKTLVVASNTITTAASGNLAATELNTALSELQSDIDTRALDSDLDTHTNASSGVHGVTGSVVGTTDTQTLSNKTLSNPLVNGYAEFDEIATPATPSANKNRIYFKSDGKFYRIDDLGVETEVGAGGGGGGAGVTYDVVLGETVAANKPVYISQGDPTDSGRVLGRAYTLDNTNDARMEFAGFTTASGNNGDTVEVQLAGELDGFSGLTVGEPVYSSGTGISSTTPSTTGHWILQLGVASSATKILINGSASSTAIKIADDTNYNIPQINFLTLSSTYSQDFSDNFNAEDSVGNWVTYADAAGSLPVDMTGGTATQLTFSRTTTAAEILNGTASFKLVKSAANAQGQGLSCVLNVPPAYQGKDASIIIPFKASGTFVEGDIKVFIYDVTNSTLIVPSRNDVLSSSGTIRAKFSVPPSASTPANIQLRVGFHFASTSTSAVTLFFDDAYVGPEVIADGAIITDWIDYTPTFENFGTTTSVSTQYRRNGSQLEVRGFFVAGTPAASVAAITLPTGLLIDTTKYSSSTRGTILGEVYYTRSAATAIYTSDGESGILFDGSTNNKVFITKSSSSQNFTKANANSIADTSGTVVFNFSVSISGWSSNLAVNNSSYFRISDYLANGTRVTGSAPTQLGQYRSYLRNASARTYTETSGTPDVAISSTSGIPLYSGNAYTSADTSGRPTLYEIFIGKNKSYKIETYRNASRTGQLQIGFNFGSVDYGMLDSYDPTTGILQLGHPRDGSSGHIAGFDINYFPASGTQAGYFDIIVSDQAIPVGVDAPRSEVYLTTGNGYGSTNNKIRRFTTTVTNSGTAITYADSATNGATFTINENGVYAIEYSDTYGAGTDGHGISLNSNQLTTAIVSITNSHILAYANNPGGGNTGYAVSTVNLRAGDVVRAHTNGLSNSTNNFSSRFKITKVSN